MLKCATSAVKSESERTRLKNKIDQLAGLEIGGQEVPKQQLYEMFQISAPGDYEPSKFEENPVKIDASLDAIERYLEDREVFDVIWDLADYSQWWGKTHLFITENKKARLVFNNHTAQITWTVAKKWLRYGKPETFISGIQITGFLRDSELPAFLHWFDKTVPEFQGNEAHKKNHNWAIDDVKMFGGSYHTAWHVKISDNTPAGEYHRNIYLHETGSGKLSWNPSGFYDPYDLITVLRLKNTGDLEEWSPKDIFDMSNYVPATPEEAPEEEEAV